MSGAKQKLTVWLSTSDALTKVTQAVGDEQEAKALIADRLQAGMLRIHVAKVIFWGASGRLQEVDVEPKPTIWDRSYNFEDDQSLWRWATGDFVVALKPTREVPASGFFLYGVQFVADEIDQLVPKMKGASRKGIGGAPRREEAWTAFWLAVIELAKVGRLSKSQFRSQGELTDEILLMINSALAPDTVKASVSQIWRRFIEP